MLCLNEIFILICILETIDFLKMIVDLEFNLLIGYLSFFNLSLLYVVVFDYKGLQGFPNF